ncbi:MAG TPA: M20/M25/M40 family metallo-hydrolase [Brevundimonas sp.]|jgi:hypothetical protein|uniref:M20/M25/M40 family metallo-hydrolase n=1 Tax=Brevundimonas sp. TaxID=1871086 RepID=UPI002DE25B88|nr:M20/M25/M40 family metallo-hydrolase [Brevundimonas sp.]
MPRWIWLPTALAAALALAVFSNLTPAPRGADAPATAFSAGRAMLDVRAVAAEPHPVGSAAHARVLTHLTARMTALGLDPARQTGVLSPAAVRRLEGWGVDATGLGATSLIGVLPGTRRELPAVLLMAHHDSVAGSPGAADDATGVAAVLETVRALQARGPRVRDVIVLITDAEELNLDGARAFFGGHPLRDRIGAVINLEARGGGGRAMMFETGRGNAETVALFARTRPDGGVTTNSLAAFVYELMPNGSDFTVPRERGVQGLNLAFIGRPEQYHTPLSTPAALDRGSLQHIGSQTLETAALLASAETLPRAGDDAVWADVFGRVVIATTPAAGWGVLAVTLLLTGFSLIALGRRGAVRWGEIGRGALEGLWFLSVAVVAAHALRALGGPSAARAEDASVYYALLSRLPWLEAGAALAALAVALMALGGRGAVDRRLTAGLVLLLALPCLLDPDARPIVLGAAAVGAGLSLIAGPRGAWPAWLGLLGLLLLLATAAQIAAPTTAFLFAWPALAIALAAAVAARFDPGLDRTPGALTISAVGALTAGWALAMAHPVFLGIGMDLPGVLAPLALLALAALRPLWKSAGRGMAAVAAVVLIAGAGVSFAGTVAQPPQDEAAQVG